MSEYLGRAFDRDLSRMLSIIVLVIGVAMLGSFAVGYWIGRITNAHTEHTK